MTNDIQNAEVPAKQAVPSMPYAGFWIRFCACFIDGLIAAVVMIPVQGLVVASQVAVGMSRGKDAHPDFTLVALSYLLSLILPWLYSALMESSSWQATLGKRACGLYVTDIRGARLTFARATGRHFAKILSALTLCIGYLMVAFTARKQGLHDIVADTLVLRARK